MCPFEGVDRLAQLQRSFLVHSYLYYKLDESIISDSVYDKLCTELLTLQRAGGHGPYDALCGVDESASGAFVEQFPPEIVTTALRLLWQHKQKPEPFENFISRYGLKLEV